MVILFQTFYITLTLLLCGFWSGLHLLNFLDATMCFPSSVWHEETTIRTSGSSLSSENITRLSRETF